MSPTSSTLLFPLLWDPITAICGKSCAVKRLQLVAWGQLRSIETHDRVGETDRREYILQL
jgi:hypothetical protein